MPSDEKGGTLAGVRPDGHRRRKGRKKVRGSVSVPSLQASPSIAFDALMWTLSVLTRKTLQSAFKVSVPTEHAVTQQARQTSEWAAWMAMYEHNADDDLKFAREAFGTIHESLEADGQ